VRTPSDKLYQQLACHAARLPEMTDAAAMAAVVAWLATRPASPDGQWFDVASALNGQDSPILRAALAHPEEPIRIRAFRAARLDTDTLMGLLRAEPSHRVRVEAVLAHDLGDDHVLELISDMTEDVVSAIELNNVPDPSRLPPTLWGKYVAALDPELPYSNRPTLSAAADWLPLAHAALRCQTCPTELRLAAAMCEGVTPAEFAQLVEDLHAGSRAPGGQDAEASPRAVRGVSRYVVEWVTDRDDVTDRTLELLIDLNPPQTPGWDTITDAFRYRLLTGLPARKVRAAVRATDNEDELMELAGTFATRCWQLEEFRKPWMRSEHAGARMYRLIRQHSGLTHQEALEQMRASWNPWEDRTLAVEMLTTEDWWASDVLARMDDTDRAGLRDDICDDLTPPLPVQVWKSIREWAGREEELAWRVPVQVALQGMGSTSVAGYASAALAPMLATAVGRLILDGLEGTDDTVTTVGDIRAMFDAATHDSTQVSDMSAMVGA
jgi:hypothetical protein